MKAYYLLAPLSIAAMVAGCSYTAAPPPVAYVAPTPTVVMGAGPAIVDSDGDGYANNVDRYPYNALFH